MLNDERVIGVTREDVIRNFEMILELIRCFCQNMYIHDIYINLSGMQYFSTDKKNP